MEKVLSSKFETRNQDPLFALLKAESDLGLPRLSGISRAVPSTTACAGSETLPGQLHEETPAAKVDSASGSFERPVVVLFSHNVSSILAEDS